MSGGWRVPGFTEVRELGAGAQGRAVLVREDRTGKARVLKYVEAGGAESLRRESALLKRVTSPYVARWYGHFEDGAGSAAILMEAVKGCSLREVLAEHGALTPEAALVVLKGSLLGLGAAHKAGVVHRDYKPANIVVEASGRSKLIDFGVAMPEGSGSRAGTPAYMAPEQWRGEPSAPATDIYAASCVFFECLTGHSPYAGDTLAEIREGHLNGPIPVGRVPEGLRGLVLKGLAKQTQERHGDALKFAKELEKTAKAAYGRSWERHGAAALGGAAAALASLFPLLGGATVVAKTTAATSLLVTGTGKTLSVVAAAMTGVLTVGAGAFFIAKAVESEPAPTPERITVTLQAEEENFTEPHPLVVRASYVRVSGMRDRELQDLINERLAAPIEKRIAHVRDVLENAAADEVTPLDTITPRILLRNDGLVSVHYDFELTNLKTGQNLWHATWSRDTAANVSMKTGRDFSGAAAFRPDLDLVDFTRRLESLAGSDFCEREPHKNLSQNALETSVHPVFTPDHLHIEIDLAGLEYSNGCGVRTVEMPYTDAADVLDPDLLPLLPATPSPPPVTPTERPLSLGPDGYGAVKLGMTLKQAQATGQIEAAGKKPPCTPLHLKQSPGGKAYALISRNADTIAAIFAVKGMSTPEGITLGTPFPRVEKAYPGMEHGPNGSGVEVPGHAKTYYGFTFDSDDNLDPGSRRISRVQQLYLALPTHGCFG